MSTRSFRPTVTFAAALILSCLATVWTLKSDASICAEIFRSTPELNSILESSLSSRGPSQSELLRAAQNDVLQLTGFNDRRAYEVTRLFDLVRLNRSMSDSVLVEFHLRQAEATLQRAGLESRSDLRSRLRQNEVYLSGAFSAAANGAVNFLAYGYLGMFAGVVHVPVVRLFNARTLPREVLEELIDVSPLNKSANATPKTRAYVQSKVRFGADAVLATARRIFNFSVLAIVLATQSDLLFDPEGAMDRRLNQATSAIANLAEAQNSDTMKLVLAKRAGFVERGETEKIAQADALIADLRQAAFNRQKTDK